VPRISCSTLPHVDEGADQVGEAVERQRGLEDLGNPVGHERLEGLHPRPDAGIGAENGIGGIVELQISAGVRPHHIEVRPAVVEGRRVEAGADEAAALGITRRVQRGDVVLLVRLGEEPDHSAMREAEDRLEVAAHGHLAVRHELVAVLRPEHVRPEQPTNGMVGREGVAGGDREQAPRGQVHAVEMPDERDVRGGGSQGELRREVPLGIAGRRRAQLAVDADRLQAPGRRVCPEAHAHAERAQARVVLVARELLEVPMVAAVRRPLEVARVGSGHGQRAQIDGRRVLGRKHGHRKHPAMRHRVRSGESSLRIGVDGRQARLHRREEPIHRHLEVIEPAMERRGFVAGHRISHADVVEWDPRELLDQAHRLQRLATGARHGNDGWTIGAEFHDREAIPEAPS